jgi:hypothetical protein
MEKSSAFVKGFPVTIIVTIVVGVVLYLVVDTIAAVSFALGSLTTLMMMSMMFKTTNKILIHEMDKVQAQKMTVRNYVIRFAFYGFILVLSAYHPNINVLFVAIGLFVFKICLYLILLFDKKRGEAK